LLAKRTLRLLLGRRLLWLQLLRLLLLQVLRQLHQELQVRPLLLLLLLLLRWCCSHLLLLHCLLHVLPPRIQRGMCRTSSSSSSRRCYSKPRQHCTSRHTMWQRHRNSPRGEPWHHYNATWQGTWCPHCTWQHV
jgi:hypothetical protein